MGDVLMVKLPVSGVVSPPGMDRTFGTGWLPPVPDLRDYSPERAEDLVIKAASKLVDAPKTLTGGGGGGGGGTLPPKVDLRPFCTPVFDQGSLGSCTANAAAGVVEYFEKRSFTRYTPASRLFIYKVTRNLMGVRGDTGAWLRNTMGALALLGAVPEAYWPYTTLAQPGPGGERTFDDEPTAFTYALAHNFEALTYFRHDTQGRLPADSLTSVKTYLAAGIPSMFGFWGFPSFGHTTVLGGIPYPCTAEEIQFGHAIVAVGYDDGKVVDNTKCGTSTTGALLIRNSWGTGWGDAGYGWLPYQYALTGLAMDFWSLLAMSWVATGQFGLASPELMFKPPIERVPVPVTAN